MVRRWVVLGLVLSSSLSAADGTYGPPASNLYWLPEYGTPRTERVASTDGGRSEPLVGRFEARSWTRPNLLARAMLFYVSEVRTPGPVTLRLAGSGSAMSIHVGQPGWHEWPLPVPTQQGDFQLDTDAADVTFKYTCFDWHYYFPSEFYRLGHVGLGTYASDPCTGLMRLLSTQVDAGCAAPDDDLIAGIPYVENSWLPPGTHRQSLRLPSSWNWDLAPLGIRWFDHGPTPTRIIGVDGGVQTPDPSGSFLYAVTDEGDGGMTRPFILEFTSDGGNVAAGFTYSPHACHPAARASLDRDESRWLGGPPGSDILFRIVPWRTGKHFLDLDGDGFGGNHFEWRTDGYEDVPLDCDDADPGRHPGVAERCNGRDDDCDGTIDGPSVATEACERRAGLCAASTHAPTDCQGGVWLSCEARGRYPASFSPEEARCDGIDEDCDGTVDDEPTPVSCALTLGVCADVHTSQCTAGTWEACDYGADFELRETRCDGLDNDCDGLSDGDDLELEPTACELQQGVCANSTHARTGCGRDGWAACTAADYGPRFEQRESACDGLDNDCDGQVDADDEDLAEALCENQLGVCAGLAHVRAECGAAGWSPCAPERRPASWQAVESRCDGLDNDCDGVTDEGCRAAPTLRRADPPQPQGCTCAASGELAWLAAFLVLARRVLRAQAPRSGAPSRWRA